MSSTLDRLTEVFQDVFEDDDLVIARETTAADVEEWDSLMHVTLVVNVEREFGLRFKSSEVSALQSVGDLVDLIERK
jgi:acyl carrier protein